VVERRDYIERLIEECARALSRALGLRQAGQLDPALRTIKEAEDSLLGPLRPVLDRLEPSSAVEIAGTLHHDHVRMYAALLGEEALVYTAQGNVASAHLCCRRSLELYAAVSLAGAILEPSDLQRLVGLMSIVDPRQLDARYRDELSRLRALGRPPA
jgi:hypothetical protein